MKKLFKRIYNYFITRLYCNETLILFAHQFRVQQKSTAEIEYAQPENLTDILFFQHPRYLETFKRFLSIGDKGYFAYLDGKCVHRSWVKHTSQKVKLHPLLPMQLQKNEAFIHYCETAPVARGNNIYPHVLTKIAEDFKDKAKILICTNAKNKASVKGIKKAGFREIERVKLVVILGIKAKRVLKSS